MKNEIKGCLLFAAGVATALTMVVLVIALEPFVGVPEIRLRWDPPAAQLLPDKTYCGESAICITNSTILDPLISERGGMIIGGGGWSVSDIEIDGGKRTVTGTCPRLSSPATSNTYVADDPDVARKGE